ncbi:MAG TPA: ABC transporter substrate-binding protein [Actinotalea sp.]|jgi:ABC-type glycerol-3-phosphate transport system substrate-binding protein
MTRRRRVAAVALSALVATALAACSSGGGSAASNDSATSGDITWWGWTPDIGVAQGYIAAFNKEYPDIKVTFKQLTIDGYNAALRPAIASSDGPDVYNVSAGSANGGVDVYGSGAIDLAPAVEKSLGADWKDKLAPSGITGLSVKDKLVGLSAGSVYSGTVWINKDIFDKLGLEPPTTFDEWKTDCAAIEASGTTCFVQGAGQPAFDMDTFEAIAENVEPGLYVDASQGKAKYTDAKLVKAFTLWKQLFDDKIMQEGALGVQQYPDANNLFMSQKAAMVMMGTWYTQYTRPDAMTSAISAAGVADPKPFTMAPIAFPDMAGTGNVGAMYGDADYGLAVSARSDAKNAATTFALWLGTSKAGQQAVADSLNDIPALKGVQPAWDSIDLVNPEAQKSLLEDMITNAEKSTAPRFATISADMNTAIGSALTSIAEGTATPEEAAATLQTTAESLR